MKCENRKLLSDIDGEVVLKCDHEDGHSFMHFDSIHGVYWPNVGSVREPLQAIHRKYVYEGAPLPRHIAAGV